MLLNSTSGLVPNKKEKEQDKEQAVGEEVKNLEEEEGNYGGGREEGKEKGSKSHNK